jgi:hypothetical protein
MVAKHCGVHLTTCNLTSTVRPGPVGGYEHVLLLAMY